MRNGGVSRRTLIKGAAATAAAACGSTVRTPRASSQSRKLTVCSWGGLFGKVIQDAIGDPFAKEHGVEIEYVRVGGSARIARMRAEKDRQTFDVVFWAPTAASIIARELNVLIPLEERADLMPRLKDLLPSTRDPKIWTPYSVPIWTYAWTLVYRTDKIPESVATGASSWNILFEREFQRRVGWPNINWGPGWGLLTLAMLNGTGTVESGRPHDVASAWSLLPRLADQVLTFYNGDDQAVQLLRSGDTVMTYRSTFEAGLLQREKVPVRAWTHLKENMIATNEAVSLVRSGDRNREELAAKFLNAALSPEAQLRLAEAFFTPINPMVKLPPALAGQLLSSREVERLNHFDWIWIGTQIDAWTEQWNKTIKRS